MTPKALSPRLDLLCKEYVLVQAWKKTANYIRYHNWYVDTLDLDWITVNLPEFIHDVAASIGNPDQWESDPLRLVPAPKSQRWHISEGSWQPRKETRISPARLRPLAYVSMRDQVVATALMLCLADQLEFEQGDPRNSYDKAESRCMVSSYGNRLFCDQIDGKLCHRWGSSKLYRSYFQDYRSFIMRPTVVAQSIERKDGQRIFIIESDLNQFYDRVRPGQLMKVLRQMQSDDVTAPFFDFAERVLDWRWHVRDERDVTNYAQAAELEDFSHVALPQGLVSAGFFANAVLVSFDEKLRNSIGEEIAEGIRLEDGCRYVDDLRIVVASENSRMDDVQDVVQVAVINWLQNLLNEKAPGLSLSYDKTKVTEFGGSHRPLIRQSRRMDWIQSAASGGFNAIAGAEILDAVHGLIRSQEALSRDVAAKDWKFTPLPDVRDETVARFSASRFRTTYRSIRPLLDESRHSEEDAEKAGTGSTDSDGVILRTRTKQDVDDDAQSFALNLIEKWIADPSNVRLLRVGFDIWPDATVLKDVLKLLIPFTQSGGKRGSSRRVAWYCLSELLRAGATETGFVEDNECLPKETCIEKYREVLRDEALRLTKLPAKNIPWYLRQQALLFLAAFYPADAPIVRRNRSAETTRYHKLIMFIRGERHRLTDSEFATLIILSHRAFPFALTSIDWTPDSLTTTQKIEIAWKDPSLTLEFSANDSCFFEDLPQNIRRDLCVDMDSKVQNMQNLIDIIQSDEYKPILRNELSLLLFSIKYLEKIQNLELMETEYISPGQIHLKMKCDSDIGDVIDLDISPIRDYAKASLYKVPDWCKPSDRWQFQLGFLLRFILSRQSDFTIIIPLEHQKRHSKAYQLMKNHWYQRLYGLFNAQQAFGDDWAPITDWMEQFLLALLCWPGCRMPKEFDWIEQGIESTQSKIKERIEFLKKKRGIATGVLMLPMVIDRPTQDSSPRPLRACVVQTVLPHTFDNGDLTLSEGSIRRRHRNHLSTALQAVRRMLDLRDTHEERGGRLDWLILPELAVHPDDVRTHLVPFARAYRTLILTGLTYQEIFSGKPVVNSALWIMPERTRSHGLQIRIRRQGKHHLAPSEQKLNVQEFRPCQWLIGYPWSKCQRPLWLSASICYDATDLGLAADLRNKSDVFAIPALNKDIKTFDQMALALHYHMFQLVVLINNGKYGGSNAYWPSTDAHRRQIFHMHGQPQASIAFLDIDTTEMSEFLKRRSLTPHPPVPHTNSPSGWKHPPAGLGE